VKRKMTRKTPQISAETWKKHQDEIIKMYKQDTLSAVSAYMERERNFFAT